MIPAKKFGIKVTQFFVGFGNTIWSTKRGETEYGFKSMPLGGYVKLVGMLPPAKDADPHEVRKTNTGLFTQLISDARNAEYEHVNDKDLDRLFYRKPWWQKLIVMAGGPTVNIMIARAVRDRVHGLRRPERRRPRCRPVSDCAISDRGRPRLHRRGPGAPAKQAGLDPATRSCRSTAPRSTEWGQLTTLIRANGNREATIEYERDGTRACRSRVDTSVIARLDVDDPTKTVNVGFLGVTPTRSMSARVPDMSADDGRLRQGHRRRNRPPARAHGRRRQGGIRRGRVANGPISVVGASRVAGEIVTVDDPAGPSALQRVLVLLAGLNLFLALFNFIPLLPLDGGHIAGALWRPIRRRIAKLRGRPDPGYVDVAKMLPVAYGVGALLMLMSVILIYADIVNPVKLADMTDLGLPAMPPPVLAPRRKTRKIKVGTVDVGGDAPVSVQSMTTTLTSDVNTTLQQIAELTAAGCDIVRVACPSQDDADALPEIAQHSNIPVIADIHFQPKYVFAAIDAGCAAVRVNPGNIRKFDDQVGAIARAAKDAGVSIRIGVNAGSLDKRIFEKYGKATPEALVESAVWEASLFEEHDFHDFKISVKHNDPVVMVQAYEQLSARGDWPLHLGVTEAGPAFQGTIKSAMAFGRC